MVLNHVLCQLSVWLSAAPGRDRRAVIPRGSGQPGRKPWEWKLWAGGRAECVRILLCRLQWQVCYFGDEGACVSLEQIPNPPPGAFR